MIRIGECLPFKKVWGDLALVYEFLFPGLWIGDIAHLRLGCCRIPQVLDFIYTHASSIYKSLRFFLQISSRHLNLGSQANHAPLKV